MKFILFIILLISIGLSFLVTAGITKLVCWCFSLIFSWKIALGVWVIEIALLALFEKEKD